MSPASHLVRWRDPVTQLPTFAYATEDELPARRSELKHEHIRYQITEVAS